MKNSELAGILTDLIQQMLTDNRTLIKSQEEKHTYTTLRQGGLRPCFLLEPFWVSHFSPGHPEIDKKHHYIWDIWREFYTLDMSSKYLRLGPRDKFTLDHLRTLILNIRMSSDAESDPQIAEVLTAGIARAKRIIVEIHEALPEVLQKAHSQRAEVEAMRRQLFLEEDAKDAREAYLARDFRGIGGLYINDRGGWSHSSVGATDRGSRLTR